jgi:hypothetical protein
MSLADALAVLATDEKALLVQMGDADDVSELQRAASAVVDTYAAAVADRYATRSAIEPFLKLIENCKRGE